MIIKQKNFTILKTANLLKTTKTVYSFRAAKMHVTEMEHKIHSIIRLYLVGFLGDKIN